MDSISADKFAEILQTGNTDSFLVLDTRPFMTYNESHVQGSVNVHLPPIVKRRSGGFVALENIVPCPEKRVDLTTGKYTRVIAYDQNTTELCSAEKDSNLYVITESLKQQVDSVYVMYLTGGFAKFKTLHPSLVANPDLSPGASSNILSTGLLSLSLPTTEPKKKECPVEILSHLYLGDVRHAGDRQMLQRMSFTAVLNVSTTCENQFESDFRYMRIPVHDNSSAELLSWFPQAISFIDSVRTDGGKVLVHCHAGVSRSVTVCLAYLMSTKNLSLDNAYEYIRQRRSVIDPNLNFMRQLKDYETELLSAKVRRNSISGTECPPLTPSNVECGFSWHSFTFPVPTTSTPLVSPS